MDSGFTTAAHTIWAYIEKDLDAFLQHHVFFLTDRRVG